MIAGLICALLLSISNRPSAVEVVAPKPPTPVVVDGKQVLVYELHITNLGTVPLQLKKIEVAPLNVELSGNVTILGGATSLEIGRRMIAWMWVPIPAGAAIPSELRHHLLFDITNATAEPKESAIDGIVVPVLHDEPVVLTSSLAPGVWLAGGALSNTSDHRRSLITTDGHAHISQRFAVDWSMIGPNDNLWHDSRERNENFWGFGQPVRAAADGEVTEVVDQFEDNVPGKTPPIALENIGGNRVIIRIAGGVYTSFMHLRHGSVRVKAHQRVKRGEVIAEVGNSGQTTGAHLHFQVTDAGSMIEAEGIPWVLDRFTVIGDAAGYPETKISSPRTKEMPAENAVVRME
jgi:hypothetical protein